MCKEQLEQDPDVLDTWFSSALWPFSTMGWPEETRELEYFYPTSAGYRSGHHILLGSPMIFSGLEFMRDVPYDILIHGLILDAQEER